MTGTTIDGATAVPDPIAGPAPAAQRTGRNETAAERADRNFNELLQELRVAQTGVQILFAFQLTLPFTQRFTAVQAEDKIVYLASVVCTAIAMACLVAPVSQHRIMFAQGLKEQLVRNTSRLAATGLVFLFLAVLGAIYLIVDLVVNTAAAGTVTGILAALFVVLWYLLPIRQRRRHRQLRQRG